MIPTPVPDDPADTLAKEIINTFCNKTNAFVAHRVLQNHMANPLEGFKVPFAPLAEKIRMCGRQMFGVVPKEQDFFSEGEEEPAAPVTQTPATVEGTLPTVPALAFPAAPPASTAATPQGVGCESENDVGSVSLDMIQRVMGSRKMRLNELARELNVEADSLAQMINNPASPLIVGTAGWIQVRV